MALPRLSLRRRFFVRSAISSSGFFADFGERGLHGEVELFRDAWNHRALLGEDAFANAGGHGVVGAAGGAEQEFLAADFKME